MTSLEKPPQTLADRLAQARRARFVGREAERARFSRMLQPGAGQPALLLQGPGGIGKTTLLAEFARMAEEAGRAVVFLDARHVEPLTDGFRRALCQALGSAGRGNDELPLPWPEGLVLLVDTFEQIAPLEHWLLQEFLPALPADAVLVLAGRTPAGAAPPDDAGSAGWTGRAARCVLGGFAQEEMQAYLQARSVPGHLRGEAAELSRGHPLALSLVADALRAGRCQVLDAPAERQLLLRSLIERLAADMPSPLHRSAFHVLIFARSTTEAMLAEVVDAEQAGALYEWLRRLPFVEEDGDGLMPHDLVRESFESEWFARDATHVKALRHALMSHVERRVRRLGGEEHFRFTRDWLYLVRDTTIGRLLDWPMFDAYHADVIRGGDDAAAVLALTAQLHGPASQAVARHWLARQSQGFRVTRDRHGRVCGHALVLDLTQVTGADLQADPGLRGVMALVAERNPLQPGSLAIATRFALHEGGLVLPNPTFSLTTVWHVARMLTDARLAWSVHMWPDIERAAPMFAHRMRGHWHHRTPEADFELDGQRFGVFMRDWKAEPNPAWQAGGLHAPAGGGPAPAAGAAEGAHEPPPPILLARDAFAAAVREALRHHTRPDKLQANPLLHTAALRRRQPRPDIGTLRAELADAVNALARHPGDRKFHHALRLTWLDPRASQEKVAAELGVPFNTYRYHLARGLDRVVQALWQRELQASRRS
jgi:hypothetical protein